MADFRNKRTFIRTTDALETSTGEINKHDAETQVPCYGSVHKSQVYNHTEGLSKTLSTGSPRIMTSTQKKGRKERCYKEQMTLSGFNAKKNSCLSSQPRRNPLIDLLWRNGGFFSPLPRQTEKGYNPSYNCSLGLLIYESEGLF